MLNSPSKARVQDHQIDTGILNWGDTYTQKHGKQDSAESVDWSTPVSSQGYDWSQPESNQTSSAFDWYKILLLIFYVNQC